MTNPRRLPTNDELAAAFVRAAQAMVDLAELVGESPCLPFASDVADMAFVKAPDVFERARDLQEGVRAQTPWLVAVSAAIVSAVDAARRQRDPDRTE